MKMRPQGFRSDEWQRFLRDGLLVLPKTCNAQDSDLALAILGALSSHGSRSLRMTNFVGLCTELARFIDHPDFIGYLYDVYGEGLKLLSSQAFVRPTDEVGEKRNDWHFDGPRVLPFNVFSAEHPLRIKVGLFLTDVSQENCGNLIYIPGSHRAKHIDQYKTHLPHPEEVQLKVPAGSIVLMFSGLWHRVAENLSPSPRKNIYLEYGPSWLQSSEQQFFNDLYLGGLTREQKIMLRLYKDPNLFYKPPVEDVPLFVNEADFTYEQYVSNDLKRYTPRVIKND